MDAPGDFDNALFLLEPAMPVWCQDYSKFGETGEAFVSACVLPAVISSGTLLICGELEHRWFGIHNGCLREEEVEVREGGDPWTFEGTFKGTSELRGCLRPGSLAS